MSIQALLDAIRASGEARAEEIASQAQVKVRQILASAEEEARQIAETERTLTLAPASGERARILHKARLETLRTVGEAREELIDAALNQALGMLREIRCDAKYPSVLARLRDEALAKVRTSLASDGELQLIADPEDKKWLGAAKGDKSAAKGVRYELECWGGLIATSKDGRVVAINTLEARLKRATPYLRRALGAFFTGELEGGTAE
jgi:vacuolar-type H+-ATPase subunit E/Vma4